MQDWISFFHFKKDVLSDDDHSYPLIGNSELVDELVYRVQASDLVFLEGAEGTGKTRLLMEIARKFGKKRQVAYLDCTSITSTVDIESLLIGKYGWWNRLFKKLPRNMIVLLDNLQKLDYKNSERVKYFFDQGNIQSAIFTAEDRQNVKFSESLWQRIGKRIIMVPLLSHQEDAELIMDRIGKNKLNNAQLRLISGASNGNIKMLLDNTREVLEHMAGQKKKKLTAQQLEEIIHGKEEGQ